MTEITSSLSAASTEASSWRKGIRSRRRRSYISAVSSQEVLQVDSRMVNEIVPWWAQGVQRRVFELSQNPQGWDSYGGRPLQRSAAVDFFDVLSTFAYAIQSEPLVSLTSEGGLIATWDNSAGSLDIITEPGQDPRIMFEDAVKETEWDGPLVASPLVEKWLWHTSAAI